MRAVLVNDQKSGAERLYIEEVETPEPENEQILVKISAFGLNRIDIMLRDNRSLINPGDNEILGVEFTGTVVKLGPNSGRWAIGDEVLGIAFGGTYAEYIAISINYVLPKPPGMSWVIAASIMVNYITAFQSLVMIAHLNEGETVLIHAGASGVGTAALQVAKTLSAKYVFTTASSEEKLQALQKLIGNQDILYTINYKTENFEEKIMDVTGNKGVDVVIDLVGQSYWNKNLNSLALDGRMVLIGGLSGRDVEKTSLAPILFKRLQITGSTLRLQKEEYVIELLQRFGKEVLPKISFRAFGDQGNGDEDDKEIHIVLHRAYPLAEIVKAHQDMETGAFVGKLVIEV